MSHLLFISWKQKVAFAENNWIIKREISRDFFSFLGLLAGSLFGSRAASFIIDFIGRSNKQSWKRRQWWGAARSCGGWSQAKATFPHNKMYLQIKTKNVCCYRRMTVNTAFSLKAYLGRKHSAKNENCECKSSGPQLHTDSCPPLVETCG